MAQTVYPPTPEADGIVRDTQHRAVLQSATGTQAAPSSRTIDQYTPPDQDQVPQSDSRDFVDNQPSMPEDEVVGSESVESTKRIPGVSKPIQEELLFEWQAQSRPFKPRTRQFFSTILIIGLLISMILFFAGQVLPIAVVIAVVFLVYVLSVIPPGLANYAITTFGIRIEDQLYYWEELGRFWFTEKYKQKILHIEVARFPWRLNMLLGEVPEKELAQLLSEVLIHQTPVPTTYEKVAAWLQEKIPLDSET